MSKDNTGGDYYDQSQTKHILNIPQANSKYDEVVDEFGEDANRELGDWLSAKGANPDALTGSQLQSARNAANYDASYKFKVRQGDFEWAKELKAMRKDARDSLEAKLSTDITTNTQNDLPVVVSSYQTSPMDSND